MQRRVLVLATAVIALVSPGCGGEAHEEAPPVATGAAIAQAPQGAVGANIASPASHASEPVQGMVPKPHGKKPKAPPDPLLDPAPDDPLPLPQDPPPTGGTTPKKGTQL